MLYELKKKTRKNGTRKNETRKQGHRVVSMILSFAVLLTLCTGCGDNSNSEDNKESSSNGETEVTVTDEHYDTYTISEIEDLNTVYCFDKTGDTYTVIGTDTAGTLTTLYKYTSSDSGLNWEREEVIGEDTNLETEDRLTKQITCAEINSDGNMIIGYGLVDSDSYVSGYEVEFIDATSGEKSELASANANDTYIRKLRSSDSDGSMYVYFDESIIKYDETGNVAYEINIPELIDFEISNTEIYALTIDALYTYDSETGDEILEDTGITKTLGEEISDTYENSQSDVINCKRVIKLNEEQNKLYLMLEETIYAYDLENTGNICQVDCDKKSGEYIYDYIIDDTDDNSIKIAAVSSGDEALKLIAYSPDELETNYDEEENKYADEEPAEITVYSLMYSSDVEAIIEVYEKKHPNINVSYEYGVSDENGVTVSDAVNALNTELMAGEGPDVILMDGLNVDDYAESGVLMELSDIYEEIIEEHPNCLEKVMKAYETEDGLYAIPSTEKIAVIIAEEDVIDSLSDIDALTEYVSTYEGTGVTNALNIYEWEVLFETYYPSYSNYIVDSEGNYDEEALREFLEDMKNLWDKLKESTPEGMIEEYEQDVEMRPYNGLLYNYIYEMFYREYTGLQVTVGILDNFEAYMVRVCNVIDNPDSGNENLTYKVISNGDEVVYTPAYTFAINNNTESSDAAVSFFKEMFEIEVQTLHCQGDYGDINYGIGFSVNTDAVYESNEMMYEDAIPYIESNVGYPYEDITIIEHVFVADEHVDEFVEVLKTLDTPSNDNRIIYEAIEDGMAEYMEGTKSLDETVSDISSTINIYVNE